MSEESPEPRVIPPCGCGTPGVADPATCYCGVEDLLRIIRRRYSLAVMNAIHSQAGARYHEIAAALPKVSSSTIAETLRALEYAGLLGRLDHRTSESPAPHTEYQLTASGTKLLNRLRQLLGEVREN